MAGPGTFFGAPLMAGTTQFPTTNPSTGAVIPSNAGTAELTQQVVLPFGSPTATIAVPPGSIITNVVAVVTTAITGATAWTLGIGTAASGNQLAAQTGTPALLVGTNNVLTLTAASQSAATIANPGLVYLTLGFTGTATAGAVSVLVQYIPTAFANDSNF